MRTAIRALAVVLLLALAGPACVEGSDERESGGPPAFLYVAPAGLFRVESLGLSAPMAFVTAPGLENVLLSSGAPDGPFQRIIFLRASNTFSSLNLGLMVETPLFTALLPAASGPRRLRLGWYGSRAYLLTETRAGGVAITQMDLLSGLETPLTGRLDQQGPGRENPVSFDISYGGNQAWVLYDSGLVIALNLYLSDETEGQAAAFGAGARDLHLMDNGALFVGGDSGLFFQTPGQPVRQISDLAGITQIRIRDPQALAVLAVTQDNGIHEINVANGYIKFFLQPPESPGAVIPVQTSWIKPTRIFPGIVLGAPPYRIAMNNDYRIYIQDPDGPNADVTATITPFDPLQNVFFTATGTDTIVHTDKSPVDQLDLSFWGGDLPGPVVIHLTATSYDGQVSQWDNPLAVTP